MTFTVAWVRTLDLEIFHSYAAADVNDIRDITQTGGLRRQAGNFSP